MKLSTCLVICVVASLVIIWLGIPEPNLHAFDWFGDALRWLQSLVVR
jgi:hypothetical protein